MHKSCSLVRPIKEMFKKQERKGKIERKRSLVKANPAHCGTLGQSFFSYSESWCSSSVAFSVDDFKRGSYRDTYDLLVRA